MKKNWTRPVIECEQFVANEYVAACYHLSCSIKNVKEFCGSEAEFYYLYSTYNGGYEWRSLGDPTNGYELGCGSTQVVKDGYSFLDVTYRYAPCYINESLYIVPLDQTYDPYTQVLTREFDREHVKEVTVFYCPGGNEDSDFCIHPVPLSDLGSTNASN